MEIVIVGHPELIRSRNLLHYFRKHRRQTITAFVRHRIPLTLIILITLTASYAQIPINAYHYHIQVPIRVQPISRPVALGRVQYIQQPPLLQIPYVNAYSYYIQIPTQSRNIGRWSSPPLGRNRQLVAPYARTIYVEPFYIPWSMTERLERQQFRREIIQHLQDRQ